MLAAQSLADADCEVPLELQRNAQPIVLLQGFAASSLVLRPLESYLTQALGRPVVRVRLGGRIAPQLGCIRSSAERVIAALDELARVRGFRHADVVGHSMGGLVATYALKKLDSRRRIRRVITLGAPHRGTPLALAGALVFGAFSQALWQMVPGSSFLRELDELPVPAGSELVAVSAGGDAVVPRGFAHVLPGPGHRNAMLARLDHLGFLHQRESLSFVRTALAA
jgi:pimeloyl-ACP methyl ester carboxylesterase